MARRPTDADQPFSGATELGSDRFSHVARRSLMKGIAMTGALGSLGGVASGAEHWTQDRRENESEPHTLTTFAALVDMVMPRTPEADRPLRPGALDIDAHRTLVTYMNTLFQFGGRGPGGGGDARTTEVLAAILDGAATELVARGLNEHPPTPRARGEGMAPTERTDDPSRAPAAGPFAKLHREDRVRTVALADQDKNDMDDAGLAPGRVGGVGGDAGLLAQFAVNVTATICYSESPGYESGMGSWLLTPPSERSFDPHQDFDDDGADEPLLGWRQTGFPGPRNGSQSLRGYLGLDGSRLGTGAVWATIDHDPPNRAVRIYRDPGSFEDTTPQTDDYEEPFPEEEWTVDERRNGDVTSTDPGGDGPLQGYVDSPTAIHEEGAGDPISGDQQ